MAFEGLSEKLNSVFKGLRGKGRLTEEDIKLAMREVRMVLLEADVSYKKRLLKAKTPYTFRERKYCTREALILAFLIYDIENLQERSFGDNDQILSIRRDSRN